MTSSYFNDIISCFLLFFSLFIQFQSSITRASSYCRQASTHNVRLFVFICITLWFFFQYRSYKKKKTIDACFFLSLSISLFCAKYLPLPPLYLGMLERICIAFYLCMNVSCLRDSIFCVCVVIS